MAAPAPLLDTAPVQLPQGWLAAASDLGFVIVAAGFGLELSANGQLGHRFERAACAGALVAGAVPVVAHAETPDAVLPQPRLST
jgi:hypothetical protein